MRALTPSRIAVKPCGVRYFSPLRARAGLADGMSGMPLTGIVYGRLSCPLMPRRSLQGGQALGVPDVTPLARVTLPVAAGPAAIARRNSGSSGNLPRLQPANSCAAVETDTAVGEGRSPFEPQPLARSRAKSPRG